MRLDVIVDDELAELLRRLAQQQDTSLAEMVRRSIRVTVHLELEKAAHAARVGATRSCVVCTLPRRADAVADAMAHAQCNAILSNVEKELADHG